MGFVAAYQQGTHHQELQPYIRLVMLCIHSWDCRENVRMTPEPMQGQGRRRTSAVVQAHRNEHLPYCVCASSSLNLHQFWLHLDLHLTIPMNEAVLCQAIAFAKAPVRILQQVPLHKH